MSRLEKKVYLFAKKENMQKQQQNVYDVTQWLQLSY